MIKKVLKFIGILAIIAIVILATLYLLFNESPPVEKPSSQADVLATEMLQSLNKEAYDTTRYYQWTFFRGANSYKYDKLENDAWVSWNGNEVYLDMDTDQRVVITPKNITDEQKKVITDTAWSNWCNDSFWLFAPFKLFDPGTSRSIVDTDEAEHGLMITYESGGVTPGDKYLWLLDTNKRPTGYKMWVSIIPMGGMYASWENWKQYEGMWLATDHKIGPMDAKLSNLKVGHTLEDMGWTQADLPKI